MQVQDEVAYVDVRCVYYLGASADEAFVGYVVVAKESTAQTIAIGHTPTGLARQIWIAASATTSASPIGTIFTFSGVLGGALLVAQTGALVGIGAVNSVLAGTSRADNILIPGIIDMTTAAANDVLGQVDWIIRYQPLYPGAVITSM